MLGRMKDWVTRESGIVVPASLDVKKDDGDVEMSRRKFGEMALGVAGALLVPAVAQSASLDDLVKHVERGQMGYEGVLEGVRESDVKKLKDFVPQIVSLSKAEDGSTVLFFDSSSKAFKLLRKETPTGANTPWIYTKEFGKAMGEWCLENVPNALVTFDFSVFNQAPSEHVIPCLQAMEAVFRLEWQKKGRYAEKSRVLTLPVVAELGKSWGIRSYYAHKKSDGSGRDQFFEQAKPYLNELRFNENAFPNTDTLRSVGYIGLAANQFMRGEKDAGNKAVLDAADYFGPWIKKQYAEKQPEKWAKFVEGSKDAHLLKMTPEEMIRQSSSYLALKRVADTLARDFHFTSELVPFYELIVNHEQGLAKYTFKAPTGFLKPEQLATCKAKAVCYAAQRSFSIMKIERSGGDIVDAYGRSFDYETDRGGFKTFPLLQNMIGNADSKPYSSVDPMLTKSIESFSSGKEVELYAFADVSRSNMYKDLPSGDQIINKSFFQGKKPLISS